MATARSRRAIRLDPILWAALADIAARRRLTIDQLTDEIARGRTTRGLATAVRIYIVEFYKRAEDARVAGALGTPRSAAPVVAPHLHRAEMLRNIGTAVHENKVQKISRVLSSSIGLDKEFVDALALAASLHDIGKLAIRDYLINKPSRLSLDEAVEMNEHTRHGHAILVGLGDDYAELPASVALNHHERFDGSGYPHGLSGNQIPMSSRIVALCDVYDALRQDRPYQAGVDHGEAMSVITRGDDRLQPTGFDPILLSAFVNCAPEIRRTWEQSGENLS